MRKYPRPRIVDTYPNKSLLFNTFSGETEVLQVEEVSKKRRRKVHRYRKPPLTKPESRVNLPRNQYEVTNCPVEL